MTFDLKDASTFVHARLLGGQLDPDDIAKLTAFYQGHNGLVVDGKPGAATLGHLNKPEPAVVPASSGLPPGLVDRRKYAAQAHGPERDWKVFDRAWEKVTGACLHQTAGLLGDKEERWDSVGAHIGIARSGMIIWLHAFNRVVQAANGFNVRTVSIEVDGLFAGVKGDPSTVWDNPRTAHREVAMSPTPAQIVSLGHVLRWISAEVAFHGGKLEFCLAHRQSSGDRPADPGAEVWSAALPIMKELGLSDGGREFKIDDGKPIPVEWDASRVGIRY